ncbi:CBS domain-containing protein [Bdellovibrio sp. 22V]|uniref:CBS domain-containing protein n=1 Tax=Bdellovibrio TaxID=958 RepID=UPI002543EC20|nr:CBS domain-containing protein [Bdellovibrio sp. 22V]WII73491.1 CBS domain-containing protein [Bdellovibrio sp. 22V]
MTDYLKSSRANPTYHWGKEQQMMEGPFMQVREIMHPDAKVLNFKHSVAEAAQLMESEDCGSIPVEKDDKMIGMVTDRDIAIRVVAHGKDPRSTKVEDIMSPGISYCFDDEDVSEVSRKMSSKQIRRLPVVDRNKRLVGMVSIGDIATKAGSARISHDTLQSVSEH